MAKRGASRKRQESRRDRNDLTCSSCGYNKTFKGRESCYACGAKLPDNRWDSGPQAPWKVGQSSYRARSRRREPPAAKENQKATPDLPFQLAQSAGLETDPPIQVDDAEMEDDSEAPHLMDEGERAELRDEKNAEITRYRSTLATLTAPQDAQARAYYQRRIDELQDEIYALYPVSQRRLGLEKSIEELDKKRKRAQDNIRVWNVLLEHWTAKRAKHQKILNSLEPQPTPNLLGDPLLEQMKRGLEVAFSEGPDKARQILQMMTEAVPHGDMSVAPSPGPVLPQRMDSAPLPKAPETEAPQSGDGNGQDSLVTSQQQSNACSRIFMQLSQMSHALCSRTPQYFKKKSRPPC